MAKNPCSYRSLEEGPAEHKQGLVCFPKSWARCVFPNLCHSTAMESMRVMMATELMYLPAVGTSNDLFREGWQQEEGFVLLVCAELLPVPRYRCRPAGLGARSSPERLRCLEHGEHCRCLLLQAASSHEHVLLMQRVQSPSSFGGAGADSSGHEQDTLCRLSFSLATPALRGAPRLRFGACPGGGRAAPAATRRGSEGTHGAPGTPEGPHRAPGEPPARGLQRNSSAPPLRSGTCEAVPSSPLLFYIFINLNGSPSSCPCGYSGFIQAVFPSMGLLGLGGSRLLPLVWHTGPLSPPRREATEQTSEPVARLQCITAGLVVSDFEREEAGSGLAGQTGAESWPSGCSFGQLPCPRGWPAW